MTVDFQFDGSKSFDQNFESFLSVLEGIDEEMAKILRADATALAAVVHDGERDSSARAAFNAAVATTLDALVEPDRDQGSS